MIKKTRIPYIPKIPQDLLDKITDGEVIVFVGSGVSMLCNVPSWGELALKYLEDWRSNGNLSYDAYEKLKKEEKNPLKLLSICNGAEGVGDLRNTLEGKLKNKLNKDDEIKIKEIYGYIRDFNANYITTNYDDFLEKAELTGNEKLKKQENEYRLKLKMSALTMLNQLGLDSDLTNVSESIVYLHGKASGPKAGIKNEIIITLEDYLKHYRDSKDGEPKNGKDFLKSIFRKATFLFIGLGLNEFEIIQHINPPLEGASHYLLLGASDYEKCVLEQYNNYYKILNIKPIFFNMSKKGHHQLEDVLRAWSIKIGKERFAFYKRRVGQQKDYENLQKIQELKDGSFR